MTLPLFSISLKDFLSMAVFQVDMGFFFPPYGSNPPHLFCVFRGFFFANSGLPGLFFPTPLLILEISGFSSPFRNFPQGDFHGFFAVLLDKFRNPSFSSLNNTKSLTFFALCFFSQSPHEFLWFP